MLERSVELIVNWWDDAYLGPSVESAMRFFSEPRQTLPIHSENVELPEVIDAMKLHRHRSKPGPRLPSWEATSINRAQFHLVNALAVNQGIE